MNTVKLIELAHSRAGDKSSTLDISLIAYNERGYGIIREKVTAERVKEFFKGIAKGAVERYELPQVFALKFVLRDALGGGILSSLAPGLYNCKTYCSALLNMDIEVEEDGA